MKPGRNDACPCGSGRKFKKCCAVAGSDPAAALRNLGDVYRSRGEREQAVEAYQRALALEPLSADIHNNLAITLRELGRLAEAEASCRAAIDIRPDLVQAHNNLGNALLDQGRTEESVASYRRALELDPGHVPSLANLGSALRSLAQFDAAEACYRQALAAAPAAAGLHYNLALVLRLQQRPADALSSCLRALELEPHFVAAMVLHGKLLADGGDFAAAEARMRDALQLDPESADAWSAIPALRRMTAADGDWLAAAERIVTRGVAAQKEAHLRYAMGKYCDDVGEFAAAFEHYRRANELRRASRPAYDRAAREVLVSRIIDTHQRRWSRQAVPAGKGAVTPVFVVGMPRSGTTLVEQILAAHPAVLGAGELMYWSDVAMAELASFATPGATGAGLADVARDYLASLRIRAPAASHVVDKMPANYMVLGLIRAALPDARIIHMQRDPLDTCLSIHFQDLDGQHPYAHDLGDLAHHYGQYLRLMAFWREALPATDIVDVPYEALVRDPDMWTRRLVEFAGLEWDDRCLDFPQRAQPVTTVSNWQVRQQVSTGSVGRWRNYEAFVGPLRDLGAGPAS